MAIFPPVYVINLKRTPERRLYMQRQLDAFGLSYQFIDAIDKVDLKSPQYRSRIGFMLGIEKAVLERKYAKIIDRTKIEACENWKSASLGQLAITLSHIKVYDLMVKNSIDVAWILEDDATLLSTFLEVLKIAPKLEWDILLLANTFDRTNSKILKDPIKRLRIFGKDLVFSSRQFKKMPLSQNKKDYRIKHLLDQYGFNSHIYSKQLESFINTMKEYDSEYAEIAKTIIPANRRWSLVKPKQYRDYKTLCRHLNPYTYMWFGAPPKKTSLNLITKHHCIAEPRGLTFSATAYLVKQHAAVKWKHEAFAENTLAIDDIPWQLYKNAQAKLRIIIPPCAVPTHNSFKYSTRLSTRLR